MPVVANLTSEQFKLEVEESKGLVLVEFYADWCPDCRAAEPIYIKIAEEMADKARYFKTDIQENTEKAQEYNVKHIPHFILFKDGQKLSEAIEITDREDILKLLTGED
jgi:thioredoxin 1